MFGAQCVINANKVKLGFRAIHYLALKLRLWVHVLDEIASKSMF